MISVLVYSKHNFRHFIINGDEETFIDMLKQEYPDIVFEDNGIIKISDFELSIRKIYPLSPQEFMEVLK